MSTGKLIVITDTVQWKEGHLSTELNGEVVLMSIDQGTYCGLDTIGSDIWRRLEQPVAVAALCQDLTAAYAADNTEIERDVLVMLNQLQAQGLIETKA